MVIRKQRNPANDRTLSISERLCLSDGKRKTGPAAGVCCCERERESERVCERERERRGEWGRGEGGGGVEAPLS